MVDMEFWLRCLLKVTCGVLGYSFWKETRDDVVEERARRDATWERASAATTSGIHGGTEGQK